jgi:hypothetical protein
MQGYEKQQFFIYENESQLGQEEDYVSKSEYLTINSGCDTFALTQSYNGWSYQWTNYTTKIQENGFGGPGGFGDGNSDKSDHSAKGIKAANEIVFNNGAISIKSYDDAIHSKNSENLENGKSPLGDVTVNGGTLSIYTNDDGIHADGILSITNGTVNITNSYEGIEGTQVQISGGNVSVYSKDDGINTTLTSGTAIEISGGDVYIYSTGDGIDSNSRTSYEGIVFSGGNTVVISNSNMNSSIDSEQGYSYTGGNVIAVMPDGGMSNEATHCKNFSSIGKSFQMSLTSGEYLVASIEGAKATVKMPVSISALIVILGDSNASVITESTSNSSLNLNGVAWQ